MCVVKDLRKANHRADETIGAMTDEQCKKPTHREKKDNASSDTASTRRELHFVLEFEADPDTPPSHKESLQGCSDKKQNASCSSLAFLIARDDRISSFQSSHLPDSSCTSQLEQARQPRRSILKTSSQINSPSADLSPVPLNGSNSQSLFDRTSSLSSNRQNVSFNSITIREYDLTVGVHPSCSCGPPVTLDWKFREECSIPLECYEEKREPRRTMRQMVMTDHTRRNILLWQFGHTEEELKRATRESTKVKRERQVTQIFLPCRKVEEVVQMAQRKVHRVVKKNVVTTNKRNLKGKNSNTTSAVQCKQ